MKGRGREYRWGTNVTTGSGYVAVPFGVDRDDFVETCFRKERIHMVIDGGTMVKDCYIDSEVLQRVDFPESYKQLGSRVVFVMDKFNSTPVIIASLTRTRERVISSEESFSIKREFGEGSLSIVGKGDGRIFIDLNSLSASKLILNLGGEESLLELNNKGVTTINADGDINLVSSSKVVKKYLNESGEVEKSLTLSSEGLKYEDDEENVLFIDYKNKKIIHNKGSEPIPLGETLKGELEKFNSKFNTFLDTFLNTPVVPGDGGKALQTAVQLAVSTLKDADFDDINSEKSFID